MRLLFCCELYHPSCGGVQEVMRQIAERMVLAGHDVTVATGHMDERNFEKLNGVRICEFKVGGSLVRGIRGEVDRYRDFVVRFAADAVLIKAAQQWTFDALWPVLDRIPGRKVFIPCGFSGLHDPAYAAYFRRLPEVLRKFDRLVFYAEKYRDIDFARAHGLTKLSVVPNGASEVEFDRPHNPRIRTQLGASDAEFVFLTIGNPIAMKGHREVAEAFARLETHGRPAILILNASWPRPRPLPDRERRVQPDATMSLRIWLAARAIAGLIYRSGQALRRHGWAGPRAHWQARMQPRRSWRELRRWINRANAQPGKRVVCVNLSRADLIDAFKTADLFVLASNIEYSPLVLFEAAAAGTPFLSVPVGNAEEIARWTGGGMICPAPIDAYGYTRVAPSVLAREMQRCMDDPDSLARLGATGKARWRESFTWKAIAPRYAAILAGAADGPP